MHAHVLVYFVHACASVYVDFSRLSPGHVGLSLQMEQDLHFPGLPDSGASEDSQGQCP